jgi:ornithine cyclodeaminase
LRRDNKLNQSKKEPLILTLSQILQLVKRLDPIQSIEDGFVAYSQGKTVVPPVGELIFNQPPGDMHIKYGYIKGNDYYVVKIASGFYENYRLGLPNYDGLMLLFSQQTGRLLGILLDEGHLTNIRTGAAGAVVAKYLAPSPVKAIGLLGAGTQGRLQLTMLKNIIACSRVYVWDISPEARAGFKEEMENQGYEVSVAESASEVAATCNLIITATPSKKPLLYLSDIQPGTHITAVGADTPEKQELDPQILARADVVVVDSRSQAQSRGEVFQALRQGTLSLGKIVELGEIIQQPQLRRQTNNQLTIADLTGVAVQDIQIAKAVYEKYWEEMS